MNRKIVQISAAVTEVPLTDGSSGKRVVTVALADDGTLWRGWQKLVGKPESYIWTQLPGLPADNSNLSKVR